MCVCLLFGAATIWLQANYQNYNLPKKNREKKCFFFRTKQMLIEIAMILLWRMKTEEKNC